MPTEVIKSPVQHGASQNSARLAYKGDRSSTVASMRMTTKRDVTANGFNFSPNYQAVVRSRQINDGLRFPQIQQRRL